MTRWHYLAIGAIAGAALFCEIALTRLFSVVQYYHGAFLAISLGLFGFAVSGVFVYLRAGTLDRERLDSALAFYGLLFAVSIPFSFYFYLYLGVRGVFEWLGVASEVAIVEAALEYALLAIPFFSAGVCIALLLFHGARESNRLYATDLVASATGAVLIIPALAVFGGPKSMLFASLAAGSATLPFRGTLRRGRWLAPAVVLASLAGVVGLPASGFNEFRLRKSATMIAGEPILWNSFSMVGVAPEEQILGVYRSRLIVIDNNVGTEMVGFHGNPAQTRMLRRDFSAAAHRLRRDADVLIIGSGGGRDIRIALAYRQRHVRAVEVNPLVVHMANDVFGDFTGRVYDARKVQKVVGDARSYIANSEEHFDIILASLIDTWAASAAGAFALTENLLYTTDAFRDYYEHLTDDGLLSVSRWHPMDTLRLLATGLEAWREMGADDPRRHAVILIRKMRRFAPIVTLMMKRSPFTSEELQALEDFAAETSTKMALSPQRVDDPVIANYLAEGVGPWAGVDVEPVPDDRPFFFNMVKPLTQVELALAGRSGRPAPWTQINLDATKVLVRLFLAVTLLVAFTILAPLLLRGGAARRRGGFSVLGYFACLGLGYILIEVGLLQRLILLLGKPVHALAVILSTMLLASGLGSFASGRLAPDRLLHRLPPLLVLVTVILALYTFLLPDWIHALLGASFAARVASAVVVVALPAFLLGMPFPSGLRVLEEGNRSELIPLVWGVNGAMSVMASVGGMILAIQFGYTIVFLVGTACYLAAALLFRSWVAAPAPVD
jgi:SAM-dependent methyltransferase